MTAQSPVIIDVPGLELTDSDTARLRHPLVGGVILFARNWRDRAQLSALCGAIKNVRGDLLIMVDHEGGRVQRFKTDGFTHLPPMRLLGQLWQGTKIADPRASAMRAARAATACGYVMGTELRACGLDLSFTPVLDLDYEASGVIGDRAFSDDPAVVSLLAKSLMHGLLQSGVANCGKHFPGHGYVRADSHTEVPVDRRSLRTILAQDAAPYAWLGTALASVMPAHVVYPKVDSRPAGFSRKWLQDVLRSQLAFGGAIFSDDLSMAGARVIDGRPVGHTEAAAAALQAGCDMVLLCNQSLDCNTAIDELLHDLDKGQGTDWHPSEASEARRIALLPRWTGCDWVQLMAHPHYQRALALLP